MSVTINNIQSTSRQNKEMVKVVVRCRPLNKQENVMGYVSVIKMYPLQGIVEIYDVKNRNPDNCKRFSFDGVYDCNCTQQELYDAMVNPLVISVIDGFNCTVFAYGQSNAGKTYTMEGILKCDATKGIIPRTFEQIFYQILNSNNVEYLVRASYLEIYQDEIRDLLDTKQKQKYELRENKEMGVYVKNMTSIVCKDVKEMLMLMLTGQQQRSTGATDFNERSSRSHAIITVTVEMRNTGGPFVNRVRVGKLNLVDLAGSERQSKTNAEGKRLKESSKINLSLTALSNVISALVCGKGFYIPYRDSKLTRLLRDSLGGNAKTLMIANIGPADFNYAETLNTLRYASRARNIKNRPRINEDPFDALIRKYQDEISVLKSQLAEKTALKEQRIKRDTHTQSTIVNAPVQNKQCLVKELNATDCNKTIISEENYVQSVEENCSRDISELEVELNYLSRRIESMESKLISGSHCKSSSILAHTHEQQRVLDAKFRDIEESKQREKEMQDLLGLKEETMGKIKKEYSNLQEEVKIKSKQLKNINRRFQNVEKVIKEVTVDFNSDRRELEMMHYELLKDLKLKLLIIENFVPYEYRRQILSKLYFDEELDCWRMSSGFEAGFALSKRQCTINKRKPKSLYTIFTSRKVNYIFRCNPTEENEQKTFRFKEENILELNLIGSSRTTKDFHSTKDKDKITSILQNALQEEDDVNIDASNIMFRIYPRQRNEMSQKSIKELPQRKYVAPLTPKQIYPKARGLVPK